jgi:phosphatidylinositol alpha 1,6-mannosyltransferase
LHGRGAYILSKSVTYPRIAYFPDSFYEVNGVAHTSRSFEAFAVREKLPFFCLRPGKPGSALLHQRSGELTTLDIPRDSVISFRIERDLNFDLAFLRYKSLIARSLEEFRPEVIHVTGPSEAGILGAWLAKSLNIPLVASWHTNLHEYAALRAGWLLRMLPRQNVPYASKQIEDLTLLVCARFYHMAETLLAPNAGLCHLLEQMTGRHCELMPRGVDTTEFSPESRSRDREDDAFVLGYCGRFSVEKNLALLVRVREQLIERGITRFRFLMVGHGKQESWLREHLPNAEFTGVLRGRELAGAYANMDLFVFPSHTDTFGIVVLEALASGVPAIVTPDGGPASIVRQGETGIVVKDGQFADAIAALILDRARHAQMRLAARAYARLASWDSVFEGVYRSYDDAIVQYSRASRLRRSHGVSHRVA